MKEGSQVCINCKEQCTLEKKSDRIVEQALSGEITMTQARQRVSVLSQDAASRIKCPSSEIHEMRKSVATRTGDHKLKALANTVKFDVKRTLEDTPTFTSLGDSPSGRKSFKSR